MASRTNRPLSQKGERAGLERDGVLGGVLWEMVRAAALPCFHVSFSLRCGPFSVTFVAIHSILFCFACFCCCCVWLFSARYLTDLNSLKINSDAEVGDIEKVTACLYQCNSLSRDAREGRTGGDRG